MPQDPFAVRDTNEADAKNGALPADFAPSCAQLRQMSQPDHPGDLAIHSRPGMVRRMRRRFAASLAQARGSSVRYENPFAPLTGHDACLRQ